MRTTSARTSARSSGIFAWSESGNQRVPSLQTWKANGLIPRKLTSNRFRERRKSARGRRRFEDGPHIIPRAHGEEADALAIKHVAGPVGAVCVPKRKGDERTVGGELVGDCLSDRLTPLSDFQFDRNEFPVVEGHEVGPTSTEFDLRDDVVAHGREVSGDGGHKRALSERHPRPGSA